MASNPWILHMKTLPILKKVMVGGVCFVLLLLPLWIVLLMGYPAIMAEPSLMKIENGVSNRCAPLNDSRALLNCYSRPVARINAQAGMYYFKDFLALFALAGAAILSLSFFAVMLVFSGE